MKIRKLPWQQTKIKNLAEVLWLKHKKNVYIYLKKKIYMTKAPQND